MNFNQVHGILLRMGDKVFNSHHGCRAGHKLLGVTVNGDLYPCHRFVSYKSKFDYNLGNVYTGGIDYECDNWKKLVSMHSEADKECEHCKVYTCNRCYATNLSLNNPSGQRPTNGYCAMNLAITNMLKKKVIQLLLDKKIELQKWEIIFMEDNKKIVVNLGDGTEICDDFEELVSRCLVELIRENKIIKSKLFNIEKHFGINEINKTDQCNIKR
jgi:radical SAM protein with 4Fe4S-binding SPASM domain